MKTIGYLVNQYPMVSQTFIRREINALEDMIAGPIRRYAVRRGNTPLNEPADRAEAERTEWILDGGLAGLALALLQALFTRPGRLARAFAGAWKLGTRNNARLIHLVYLAEACRLLIWTQRDRIDHLHVHFGTNSTTVAWLCRRLGGPAYSFTVHGPEEFDRPVALGLPEKVHEAAFVVNVCAFGRSQLWRWSEFADWSKIHVVHCGLDPSFLDVPRTPIPASDAPRLVNIGRLAEQKGQLVLVEAAGLLRDRGRKFVVLILGDGPFRPALEQRIAALGLAEHVQLLGWSTGEQVRDALLSAHALVLPSFAEGLPVAIMEAFALGRPVVSTYIAGTPELVRPNQSGWLVPAGDASALADAVEQLLDTPLDRLAAMAQLGAAQVAREHDVRREAAKLLALIEAAPR
ncbi:MAG: glycosyltransferase [Isosphaeraceae bacterium]